MKRIRKFNFVQLTFAQLAVATAIAICCTPGTANAQARSYQFNLPYEAHWGLATLPAGNYSVRIEGVGTNAKIRVQHGSDTVAIIATQNYDRQPSNKFLLTVVRSSAGNFVRDVTVPEIDEVFHFTVKTTGPVKQEELAHARLMNGTK